MVCEAQEATDGRVFTHTNWDSESLENRQGQKGLTWLMWTMNDKKMSVFIIWVVQLLDIFGPEQDIGNYTEYSWNLLRPLKFSEDFLIFQWSTDLKSNATVSPWLEANTDILKDEIN